MASRIEGDHHFVGTVTGASLTPSDSTITNAKVAAAAAIAADKMEHRWRKTFSQDGLPAAETHVIHIVRGATGTINEFAVTLGEAKLSSGTVDVDLLKNGSSVLSAAVQLDSADALYDVLTGTISSASVVVDDVLVINITVSSPVGAAGLGVQLEIDEDPA